MTGIEADCLIAIPIYKRLYNRVIASISLCLIRHKDTKILSRYLSVYHRLVYIRFGDKKLRKAIGYLDGVEDTLACKRLSNTALAYAVNVQYVGYHPYGSSIITNNGCK